jgi:hypothetical protein
MRNPFKRTRRALDEAREAREKAERELEATRKETPKYRALGRALSEIVEDNHLADALTDAFRSNR